MYKSNFNPNLLDGRKDNSSNHTEQVNKNYEYFNELYSSKMTSVIVTQE